MKEYNQISDREINDLLRKRILDQSDMELLEREAKVTEPLMVFSETKEKELIQKLNRANHLKKYFKWFFIGSVILGVVSLTFIFRLQEPSSKNIHQEPSTKNSAEVTPSSHAKIASSPEKLMLNRSKLIKNRRVGPSGTSNSYSLDFNGGQLVEKILQENADCITPILVKDTVVFSPHTPIGTGNELEILNNDPNDELYFENEHNTVWYKFWAKEDGLLTFDIIPVDPNDDYDFMLFRYDGGDFRSKILSKQLKPVRTCISRNDTSIQGKTGLSLNEPVKYFIHSGPSQSYVKYLEVKKGETFYLLIDNVYIKGNGHMIRFHYTPFDSRKLYIGKSIAVENVMFKSDDYKFEKGAKVGLDSLYKFLQNNPNLKVEIQGHVNTGSRARPIFYEAYELSRLRAEAIYNYIIDKGISKERLSYAGYSDWRKKVALPITIKEYRLNILADILILSLDYKADLEWRKAHPSQPNAPH